MVIRIAGVVTPAARNRANQIAEDSNLRDTPEFRAIQATWADQLLTKASQAEDPVEKRKLLEEVARATAVDSSFHSLLQYVAIHQRSCQRRHLPCARLFGRRLAG